MEGTNHVTNIFVVGSAWKQEKTLTEIVLSASAWDLNGKQLKKY